MTENNKKSVIEEMGMSREEYYKLYDDNSGFNSQFNKNSAEHAPQETFYDFLNKGARRLVEANTELVRSLSEE